jgi:hypothetical protein
MLVVFLAPAYLWQRATKAGDNRRVHFWAYIVTIVFFITIIFMPVVEMMLFERESKYNDEFFDLCSNGTPQQVEEAIKAGAKVNAKKLNSRRI